MVSNTSRAVRPKGFCRLRPPILLLPRAEALNVGPADLDLSQGGRAIEGTEQDLGSPDTAQGVREHRERRIQDGGVVEDLPSQVPFSDRWRAGLVDRAFDPADAALLVSSAVLPGADSSV